MSKILSRGALCAAVCLGSYIVMPNTLSAEEPSSPRSWGVTYDENVSSLVPQGTYPALDRYDVVSTGSIFSPGESPSAPRSWGVTYDENVSSIVPDGIFPARGRD
jgi:hypothetical protein